MARSQVITFIALILILALQTANLVTLRKLRSAPIPTPLPISNLQYPVSASPSAEISQKLDNIQDQLTKLRADQRDLTQILGLTTASPAPAPVTNLTADANYPSVNVYDQPNLSAKIVGRINPGRAYPYSTLQNNWYHITLPDGTSAWVESQYVKPL